MSWGAILARTTSLSARDDLHNGLAFADHPAYGVNSWTRIIASCAVFLIFENECSGVGVPWKKFGGTIYLRITAALSFEDAYDNPTPRHEAAASTKKSLIRA